MRNKEIVGLIVSMSDIVNYVVDVEQFATVAQLKAVIGEANELMEKTVKFVNEHKERGTFSKRSSSIQLVRLSSSQSQYPEKVVAAFSPSAKEELEGLQDSFSRFKEKFDRGLAVQATTDISSINSQVRTLESQLSTLNPQLSALESQLRTLGEYLYVLKTFINKILFSPRQRR